MIKEGLARPPYLFQEFSVISSAKNLFRKRRLIKRHFPISAAKFPEFALFKNRFRWNFAERFLGSKQSNVPSQFFKIRPTSGFMSNFRFRLVFQISRYTIDQSKLGIAQIEALNQIKNFYYVSLGLGSLGGICGHLGSKSKHFKT